MNIPSHTISRLWFPDCPIMFTLEIEIPCSWNNIVIRNWIPWSHPPCVPYHKTLNLFIHCLKMILPCFHLIRTPYMLEYQDRGFENWEHKILSYETLMAYTNNLLHPTEPVATGYNYYIHWGIQFLITMFTLEIEIPCSWNNIVIRNWIPWSHPPCVPYHKTLNLFIHCLKMILPCFHLIRTPYMLEYQDRGFENWEHKILSYETLMAYTYNLLHPTEPVATGYNSYLHWY